VRRAAILCLAAALAVPALNGASGKDAKRAAPSAAQLAEGKRAFQKCYACHSLKEADLSLPGPTLKGIIGKPVAAEPGFDYSSAMRAHARQQPRWSRTALDAFIADPYAVVPDTEMGFFGIRNPAERAALIAYIEAQK